MAKEGELWFSIGADGTGFNRVANDTNKRIRVMHDNVIDLSSTMNSTFKSAAKALAGLFAADRMRAFANEVINVRKEMEQLEISFKTLTGSEKAGKAMYDEIVKFGQQTPLLEKDLAKAAQTMLAFNIEQEKVVPLLKQFGDISMGDAQKLQSLALAFSQTSSTGKLMGQDLLQMINAGFNPLAEIARKTGRDMSELKEEMSEGKISVEMVEDAFKSATSEGGKFHGMLTSMGDSMGGALSNMEGSLDKLYNRIGELTQDSVVEGAKMATEALDALTENIEEVASAVGQAIVMFGSYKAACMVAATANNVAAASAAGYSIKTQLLRKQVQLMQVAQALLNKTMLTNPYVLAGVAIGALGIAIYKVATAATGAELAVKDFNEELEETKRKQEELNGKIEEAIALYQDDASSVADRERALYSLGEEYRNIFRKYIDEKGHLRDLIGLKRELAALEGKERVSSSEDKAQKYGRYADVLEKAGYNYNTSYLTKEELKVYNMAQKELENSFGWFERQGMDAKDRIDFFRKKSQLFKQEAGNQRTQNSVDEFINSIADRDKEDAKKWQKVLQNAQKKLKGNYKRVRVAGLGDVNAEQIESMLSQLDKRIPKNTVLTFEVRLNSAKTKADLEVLKKNIEKDLEKLSPEAAAGAAGEKLKKNIQAVDKKLKLYDSKDTSAADNRKAEREQRELERQLHASEAVYQELLRMQQRNDQERIALMKEGHDKRMAEIDNEHQKELNAISAQAVKWAKANKTAGLDGTSSVTIDGEGYGGLTQLQADALQKSIDYANDKKKKSIDSYNKETERSEKEAYIRLLSEYGNYEEQKQAIMLKYQQQADEIRNSGKSEAEQGFLIEINNAEQDTELQALEEKFKGVTQHFADLFTDAASKSVVEIQTIIDKYEELISALEDSTLSEDEITKLKGIGFSEQDIQSIKKGEVSIHDLREGITALQGEVEDRSPWLKFKSSMEDAIESIKNGKVGEGIEGIGNAVSAFAPHVKQFANNLGNIFGSSDFGEKAGKVMDGVQGLGNAAKGVGQIMSGDVVGGVMAVVDGISQMVDALDGLFGADYTQYNKMVEQYEKLSVVWDEIIAKKKEYVSISYGDEARKTAKEIEEIYGNELEALRALGKERLNAGASAGSHSIGVRQRKRMTSDILADVARAADEAGFNYEDVVGGRMTGLFDLSAKQLTTLKEEAPLFWTKLDKDVQEYLNKIIECGDALEENKKAMQETFTGMSFDAFFDSFKSLVTDMSSTFSDMTDEFGDNLRESILENLLANKYKERLQTLYDDWVKAADSNGDGTFDLDANESAALRESQKTLAEEIIRERDALAEALGWETGEDLTEGTSRGAETISEETGGEISGRMASLQISGENISAGIQEAVSSLQNIAAIGSESREYLREMLTQQALANGYLDDILRQHKVSYQELVNILTTISSKL